MFYLRFYYDTKIEETDVGSCAGNKITKGGSEDPPFSSKHKTMIASYNAFYQPLRIVEQRSVVEQMVFRYAGFLLAAVVLCRIYAFEYV